MRKWRVGLVTAWAECGMGYLAKNWVYTFRKNLDRLEYQIYSRALPVIAPFRWRSDKVVTGPTGMAINHDHFWNWVETFKPDVILFQDQNTYGASGMREETARLRRLGIRTINYPDWIKWPDIKKFQRLYDVLLTHVKRNYRWFSEAGLDDTVYIPWGVILKHFPFVERHPRDLVKFYTNLGTGTVRKGYPLIPTALQRLEGNFLQRHLRPKHYEYRFIATAVEHSAHRVKKKFIRQFSANSRCEFTFETADNRAGGLFTLGDVYIYPSLREGVGLTITEALCTGMPVVTTDYPTMNEWFEDGRAGRLIKTAKVKRGSMPTHKAYADVRHLAEIMEDYIRHPGQIREQSHQARKLVEERYNWDHRDEAILKLIMG